MFRSVGHLHQNDIYSGVLSESTGVKEIQQPCFKRVKGLEELIDNIEIIGKK